MSNKPIKWAYGVTTVPSRSNTFLVDTINSLCDAGFDYPLVFCDGPPDGVVAYDYRNYFSYRVSRIGAYGNYILGLWELLIRNPTCQRFAMFQDDILVSKNLRAYLDRCRIPDKTYLNLCTYRQNEELCPENFTGWYLSNQMGRGAQALVFTREGLRQLLSSSILVDHPLQGSLKKNRSIDGAISNAFKKLGWSECVHMPSLVDHVGTQTVIEQHASETFMPSFRGENFDCLELLDGVRG